MSGHSKWSKIRHKKGIKDLKRGKIFSKMAQQIAVAARDGGGDPDSNFSLRLLIDKAKAVSMPAENIKRAIDRGVGNGEEGSLENVFYEGYGPGKVSIIVEAITDNKNRTVAELRKLFSDAGGNLAESGAVSWNFDQRGLVVVESAKLQKSDKYGEPDIHVPEEIEKTMLSLMDISGVIDVDTTQYEEDADEDDDVEKREHLRLFTEARDLSSVRDGVHKLGYIVKDAELTWIPRIYKKTPPGDIEKIQSFIEKLEEIDDVHNIWMDVKLDGADI